jgi:uncharacterized delta-60 repeat protein
MVAVPDPGRGGHSSGPQPEAATRRTTRHSTGRPLRRASRSIVEPIERRVLLSAGNLDRSFSGDGLLTTDFGGGFDGASAVTVLPDGKLLVAGVGGATGEFAVARYLPDGRLDPAFGGGDGKATGDFSQGDRTWARAYDIALLPGGKYVLAGVMTIDDTWSEDVTAEAGAVATVRPPGLGTVYDVFALARFNADGSTDKTFGDAGHVFSTFLFDDHADSVAVQSDGKLLVAGRAHEGLIVARYNADGTLDTSFGDGGRLLEPQWSWATDVAVAGDKILVAGAFDGALSVIRYDRDGTRDMTFGGGDGVAGGRPAGFEGEMRGSHAEALAIQADGRIVAAGAISTDDPSDPADLVLARFNRDGSLDATFARGGGDGDGRLILDPAGGAAATGVGFGPHGQILLSIGVPFASGAFGVARFNADGSIDPIYGRGGADGDGIASATFAQPATGLALAVLPDGRAVVAGAAGGDFAVARFAADSPGPDGDGNDQTFEATRLNVGSTWNQNIANKQDVDLYAFSAAAGQRVGFDVDVPAGGAVDAYLRVFAADGTQLAANENGAAPGEVLGQTPYAEFTFSAPGTYYVGVSASGNRGYSAVAGTGDAAGTAAGGSFTLSLTDRTPRPPVDGDDQIGEAVATRVGATVTRKALTPFDVDVYKFIARAGQRVGFDTGGASGEKPDTYLRLFTAAGVELGANDNGAAPSEAADGRSSYFEFTFSAAGTYYLGVSGAPNGAYDPLTGLRDIAGSTGRYTLRLIDRPAGPAAPPAQPPAGTLDASFSDDGTVTTAFGTPWYGYTVANAVTIQPDGKIVAAGVASVGNQQSFGVARYLPDGRLDTTFGGGDGTTVTNFGMNWDWAYGATVLSNGKILVVGTARPSSFDDADFGIARYNPDGSLDAGFGGGDGMVTTSFGSPVDGARAVVGLPDGKFLVAGQGGRGAMPGWEGMVLARYRSDGSLDTSFGGGDGFVTVPTDPAGGATSMVVAPDGKVILGGPVVARFLADGSPDATFGSGGVAIARGGGGTVSLQPDGKIVVARADTGYGGVNYLVVSRLDASGQLDPSYGTEITLGPLVPWEPALAVLPGGKVLVAGGGLSGPQTPADEAAASFSRSNPSPAATGSFSYGYKAGPTGTFNRFGFYDDNDGHEDLESHTVADNAVPSVSKNIGAFGVNVGDLYVPGGRMVLRPGPDGPQAVSVVRFTANTSGTYSVRAEFEATDNLGASSVAHVVTSGTGPQLFAPLNGVGASQTFIYHFDLRALDTIDFMVTNGGNGPSHDGTLLNAIVELLAPSPRDLFVGRLTVDGRPDGTFDGTATAPGDGFILTDMGRMEVARAVAVQPNGRIVVAGSSYAGGLAGESGDFALARFLGDRRGPDGDPDDQLSEAARVVPGGARPGGTLGGTDVDVYEFVVTGEGRRIGFDVDGSAPDALLRLFTRKGAELALNDNGAAPGESAGTNPYLEFTFAAPGTYYVGLSASANRAYNPVAGGGDVAGPAGGGGYTLTLTDRTPVAPADADDQLSEARPMTVGSTLDGRIDRGTDVDVLAFNASVAQHVVFKATAVSGGLRPHLRLFDADGNELAAGDAGSTVNGSVLDFRFSAGGRYYLAVSSRPNVAYDLLTGNGDCGGGAAGGYRLTSRNTALLGM